MTPQIDIQLELIERRQAERREQARTERLAKAMADAAEPPRTVQVSGERTRRAAIERTAPGAMTMSADTTGHSMTKPAASCTGDVCHEKPLAA